ncbi:hypothetical protein E0W68_11545 [Flavobacterium salilacus subsp. salilacus]|uniref:hypothetical protein n=1 Tax=Flavobacterium TaxID=237 RepID=UPI0010757D69|nr:MULTISPECIES: hypothetical protein [Flavobacterium]KAF2516842.1 hypothetical protein E0W68_11545 [Flavobacterium salilacus subsp. salilacus]MBE1615799.1 hypothetical protein [Flavobacterium sp. SaA2.13]
MSQFKQYILEPLKPTAIEADISKNNIILFFKNYDWRFFLKQLEEANEKDINWSPTLEFENKENKHSLSISAVGSHSDYIFYIFYKRPKKVKKWFGLTEAMNKNYVSELLDQTEEDTSKYLQALIEGNYNYLEEKINK